MTQTIAISRKGGHRDEIDADVEGDFAIHETIPLVLGGWTLTHVPTGWAALPCRWRGDAIKARAELLASGLDWSFTEPCAMSDAHRTLGRALVQKYGGR